MLDVILINEGQYLVFDCWEVGDLEDRGSLIVVFIQ